MVVLIVGGCGGSAETRPEIAFVSTRDGDYSIYEMSADGDGQRRLTEGESSSSTPENLFFQVEPSWSPDGTKIAFSSRREGSFDIFVMNADGTGSRRLTSTKEDDSHPTWSPDGTRIAFARSRPADIFVMNADGSGARSITNPTIEETEPAWSPNGRWIAYVRRTPGTGIREVWLTRPDGSERRAVTSAGATAFAPAWSPDSARIAFSSNANGEVFELFTIGVDGKELGSVATTAEGMFEPAWSPNGELIAFSEGGAIFSVELGGGDPRKLTDTSGNDSSPSWNPRPPPDEEG
jgi:Tol biopolymer transport system component